MGNNIIVVTKAVYVRDRVLELSFSDGLKGRVDFSDWIDRFPFFEPLKEAAYFKNFSLDEWTVSWPNGADIAPETLHEIVAKKSHPQAA